jgi:hypothetical protein
MAVRACWCAVFMATFFAPKTRLVFRSEHRAMPTVLNMVEAIPNSINV